MFTRRCLQSHRRQCHGSWQSMMDPGSFSFTREKASRIRSNWVVWRMYVCLTLVRILFRSQVPCRKLVSYPALLLRLCFVLHSFLVSCFMLIYSVISSPCVFPTCVIVCPAVISFTCPLLSFRPKYVQSLCVPFSQGQFVVVSWVKCSSSFPSV